MWWIFINLHIFDSVFIDSGGASQLGCPNHCSLLMEAFQLTHLIDMVLCIPQKLSGILSNPLVFLPDVVAIQFMRRAQLNEKSLCIYIYAQKARGQYIYVVVTVLCMTSSQQTVLKVIHVYLYIFIQQLLSHA